MITGFSSHGGLPAQQHVDAYSTFYKFLSDTRPCRVLEIGTAHGGFILSLRQSLDKLDLSASTVDTVDVIKAPHSEVLEAANIRVHRINLFNSGYTKLHETEWVSKLVQQEGVTLVLCDGGNKPVEFNELAPLLKRGDFIMAHDYCTTPEDFKKDYQGKVWNWLEIQESHIRDVSAKENLVAYDKAQFDKVMWVCKRKL